MDALLGSFDERLKDFRIFDQNRDRFVIDLFESLQKLKQDHERLIDDYENERESRRRIQTIQREKTMELQVLRRAIDNSAYTITLIDGDGAPFVDSLLQQGNVGGVEAASRLAAAIKDHIAELYPDEGADWKSVVQIYLNLDGLSRKLFACKIVDNSTFIEFIRDFNSTSPLINIIDVGQGKERADHKVRENFNFHLVSPTCKHIVFGGCHDKGYLNILREHQYTKAATSKISLLSTFTDVQAISETANFNHVKFPQVFRSAPLPDRPVRLPSPPPAAAKVQANNSAAKTANLVTLAAAPVPVVSSTTQHAPPIRETPMQANGPASTTNERDYPSLGQPSPGPSKNGSYAGVGATTSGSQSFSIASSKKKPANDNRPCYYVNKDQTRIDLPFKTDPKDYTSVKAKGERNGRNYCTPLAVFGHCENNYCNFNHDIAGLTAGERAIIKRLGRNLPCQNGNACEDPWCTYGHVCVNEYCNRAKCRFHDDQHGVDLRPYRRVFEDGSMQAC